jgi:23S rRNA (adenine2503-C2)-methyltransferase
MQSIHLISKEDIASAIAHLAPARYRIDQIRDGLYKHFYQDWSEFSNLPTQLIEYLSQNFSISSLYLKDSISSENGRTQKYLFQLSDDALIEAVLIRNDERNTICISTQVGCAVGCAFCATGAAGFSRNLNADEIIDQVSFIAYSLAKNNETITNIVLMGMGEPFLNYDQTIKAVSIFNHPEMFDIGARRITISTIGIPDKIRQFAEIGKQYNLAISLHAPNDIIRKELIPLARKISIDAILESANYYIEKTNRRITYEYVLIKGINDKDEHAIELAAILRKQKCHINLIALNKNEHFPGNPPDETRTHAFIQILLDAGIPTTLRDSQGAGIQAGCGQLSGKYK